MENTQMMKTNSKELLRFCARVLVFVVFSFFSYSYAQVYSRGAIIHNQDDITETSEIENLIAKDFYITKNAFVYFENKSSNAYTKIASEQKIVVNKKSSGKKKKPVLVSRKPILKETKCAIRSNIVIYNASNHNSSHFTISIIDNSIAILVKSNTVSLADIIINKEIIISDNIKYFYPKYFYLFYTKTNTFSIAIRPPPIA